MFKKGSREATKGYRKGPKEGVSFQVRVMLCELRVFTLRALCV